MKITAKKTGPHPMQNVILRSYKKRQVHDRITLAYELAEGLPTGKGAATEFKKYLCPAQEALEHIAS